MAAYLRANQPIVIKQRKDGSVYLKGKISLQRYLIGLGVLLVSLLILTQIIVYRINEYKEEQLREQERISQLKELQKLSDLNNLKSLAHKSALAASKIALVGVPPPTKEDKMKNGLVSYIASHYLISEKGAEKIVDATIEASKSKKIEPSLITAIIAIESRFNPYAKSKGNAEGLMQVIPFWHPEKMKSIGGTKNIIETRENIIAGTATVKEYLTKFNNNKELALQQYNGSLEDKRRKYSRAVLGEKSRIDQWLNSRIH